MLPLIEVSQSQLNLKKEAIKYMDFEDIENMKY